MHVHILGVCGTFMGGVAAIARAAGFRVTGSDRNVYPPMSTQLQALGIEVTEGFEAAQLDPAPDMVVVGNVMTRGQPVIEALLERDIPYLSGPEWLAREVLKDRWVLAVAGTHGKTTCSSLLAWILEHAGLSPGFLIGGVPTNFGLSARLGAAPFFVIEADEYDTAFFDKRAKFVHYRPRTVILNNLEFDHADIYPDVASIQRQFHHLVRTVPGGGRIVWNAADELLRETLQMGCWTPLEGFARTARPAALWTAQGTADFSRFDVFEGAAARCTVGVVAARGPNIAKRMPHGDRSGAPSALMCQLRSRRSRTSRRLRRRMRLRGESAPSRV
jgi:UDP-N-acetylmuramate: L-alanyl-gamma-D-glutamyl-meso-diaminopimelate ligase